jgi:hypothetical protein
VAIRSTNSATPSNSMASKGRARTTGAVDAPSGPAERLERTLGSGRRWLSRLLDEGKRTCWSQEWTLVLAVSSVSAHLSHRSVPTSSLDVLEQFELCR